MCVCVLLTEEYSGAGGYGRRLPNGDLPVAVFVTQRAGVWLPGRRRAAVHQRADQHPPAARRGLQRPAATDQLVAV